MFSDDNVFIDGVPIELRSELTVPKGGVVLAVSVPTHHMPSLNYLVHCTCECGATIGLKMTGDGSWLIMADINLRCEKCGYMFVLSRTNITTTLGDGKVTT